LFDFNREEISMSTVEIPESLWRQIEGVGVAGRAVEEFVQQAIREKLAEEERKQEFFRLSDEMRAAMLRQGITEEQMIAEFDSLRHSN
jgi:hypothetical protein